MSSSRLQPPTTALVLALAAVALTPVGALAQTPAPLKVGGQPGAIADRYIVVMNSRPATLRSSAPRTRHEQGAAESVAITATR
jgi:hypothetical protein